MWHTHVTIVIGVRRIDTSVDVAYVKDSGLKRRQKVSVGAYLVQFPFGTINQK